MERRQRGHDWDARRAPAAALVALGLVVAALALWAAEADRRPAAVRDRDRVGDAARRGGAATARGSTVGRDRDPLRRAVRAGRGALWLAVPAQSTRCSRPSRRVPEARTRSARRRGRSRGLKRDVLLGLQRRLEALPSRDKLVEPGVEVTSHAIEVFVGVFFVFASAAYWIFERERASRSCSLRPASQAPVVSDTWNLIDLKLGARAGPAAAGGRGRGRRCRLFWAIGEPYWLLVGSFAGLVELVLIIGPLAAGTLAVAVGLTASWETGCTRGSPCGRAGARGLPRDAEGLGPGGLAVDRVFAVFAAGIVMGGSRCCSRSPLRPWSRRSGRLVAGRPAELRVPR